MLGYHRNNWPALGCIAIQKILGKNTVGHRKLASSVIEESEDDKLSAAKVSAAEFARQWTRWCDYIMLDLSWKNLLAIPQPLLSFCLSATYGTLPYSSNLYKWHIAPEAVFSLFEASLHISPRPRSMQGCITARKIYFILWYSIVSFCIDNKKFINIVPVS